MKLQKNSINKSKECKYTYSMNILGLYNCFQLNYDNKLMTQNRQ